MPALKKSITLPAEMVDYIESKVASGQYGSDSEVIRDGLRALQKRDDVVERWLESEVAAAYDAMKSDPSGATSGEEIRDRLYRLIERRNPNAA